MLILDPVTTPKVLIYIQTYFFFDKYYKGKKNLSNVTVAHLCNISQHLSQHVTIAIFPITNLVEFQSFNYKIWTNFQIQLLTTTKWTHI